MNDKKLEYMINFISKVQELDFKNFAKALISIETNCTNEEILEETYHLLMSSSEINLIDERIREVIEDKSKQPNVFNALINGLQTHSIDWSDEESRDKFRYEILDEIDTDDFKSNLKNKIEEFFNDYRA